MIPPELLHRLRLAQRRSAQEQQLLSGRDWILVAGLVQTELVAREHCEHHTEPLALQRQHVAQRIDYALDVQRLPS